MDAWLKKELIFAGFVAFSFASAGLNMPVLGQTTPELNYRVLSFARAHVDQKVGNGECSSLAAEALRNAGAQLARGFTFGRELAAHETWLPGDIIQFTNCLFLENNGARWQVGTPTHTAVFDSARGRITTIISQNSNNDRITHIQTLDFDTLVSGSYKVYRPISDSPQTAIRKDLPQSSTGIPNLIAILRQPVVDGPLRQARAEIQEKIRRLQAKGVNTYFYRQKFQEIEMIASTSDADSAKTGGNGLAEAVAALNQQLALKESP